MTYRAPARSQPSFACPLCQAPAVDGRPCVACALVLQTECWKGIRLGLRWSPLLALLLVPAACLPTFSLPAMGAWLLGPFVWAVLFRRRPGARARERAIGVAGGHAAWVVLVVVALAGSLAVAAGGLPN